MSSSTRLLGIRIALTLTCFEFFGPMLRDFSPSHVLNPDWVGHARLHVVWLLGFMLFSGIANLYLIWLRRPFELRNLWLSAAWQGCNLGGFWLAIVVLPAYDGVIAVPGIHMEILGIDENILAFTLLTLLLGGACLALLGVSREAERAAR